MTNDFILGINTFCSQILCGITLPLLLIAPFTFYVRFPKFFQTCNQQGDLLKTQYRTDLKQGDLYLYEKQSLTQYAIFKLCAKYILYHSTRVSPCISCREDGIRKLISYEISGILLHARSRHPLPAFDGVDDIRPKIHI